MKILNAVVIFFTLSSLEAQVCKQGTTITTVDGKENCTLCLPINNNGSIVNTVVYTGPCSPYAKDVVVDKTYKPYVPNTLNLSSKNIVNIPSRAFCGLKDIRTLYLANNKIEHIQNGAFECLSSLNTLDLSKNSISYLEDNAFKNLDNLQLLKLAGNKIKTISKKQLALKKDCKVSGVGVLVDISLNSACSGEIKLGTTKVYDRCYLCLKTSIIPDGQLIYSGSCRSQCKSNKGKIDRCIDLRNKNITSIPKNAFKGFDLEKIYLTNNRIVEFEQDAFVYLKDIRTPVYLFFDNDIEICLSRIGLYNSNSNTHIVGPSTIEYYCQ